MASNEENWRLEYRRQQARERIRGLKRALWLWALFAVVCLTIKLSYYHGERLSFTDFLILMMIVINVGNTVRELVLIRRILTGRNPQKDRENP